MNRVRSIYLAWHALEELFWTLSGVALDQQLSRTQVDIGKLSGSPRRCDLSRLTLHLATSHFLITAATK